MEASPFSRSSEAGQFEVLDTGDRDNQMDLWAKPSFQPKGEDQFILKPETLDLTF